MCFETRETQHNVRSIRCCRGPEAAVRPVLSAAGPWNSCKVQTERDLGLTWVCQGWLLAWWRQPSPP